MAAPIPPYPPADPLPEIRALLHEIRQQNIMLKRYICVLAGGLTLLILMQTEWISTIIQYSIIVLIVMAVLLTAPLWSQLIIRITDRIPGYPRKK